MSHGSKHDAIATICWLKNAGGVNTSSKVCEELVILCIRDRRAFKTNRINTRIREVFLLQNPPGRTRPYLYLAANAIVTRRCTGACCPESHSVRAWRE